MTSLAPVLSSFGPCLPCNSFAAPSPCDVSGDQYIVAQESIGSVFARFIDFEPLRKILSRFSPFGAATPLEPTPTRYKRNIVEVANLTRQVIAGARHTAGINYFGRFKLTNPQHRALRQGVLNLMSEILTLFPVNAADGIDNDRNWVSLSRDFSEDEIRKIGRHLSPIRFNPRKVIALIGNRFDLLDFYVRTPSPLFGFHFGCASSGGHTIDSISFSIYDGGQAMSSKGKYHERIAYFNIPCGMEYMDIDLGTYRTNPRDLSDFSVKVI